MPWLIGVDEAGYGPNLGPLVISATLWETPGDPDECDLWTELAGVVTDSPTEGDLRLHLADSKQVYSPTKGTHALERGVLAALEAAEHSADTFDALCRRLTADRSASLPWRADDVPTHTAEPWFADLSENLPLDERCTDVAANAAALRSAFESTGLRLIRVVSEVVYASRFNRLVDAWGNKSAVLSRLTLGLVRSLWNPAGAERCVVLCDKHGGRNRYQELLLEISDGVMVLTAGESRDASRYRVGAAEFRFQVKCERHLPTALASMVSKYVREVAMRQFNRWWNARVPDLKPTAGYPEDARRFRLAVSSHLREIGLADDVYWRKR